MNSENLSPYVEMYSQDSLQKAKTKRESLTNSVYHLELSDNQPLYSIDYDGWSIHLKAKPNIFVVTLESNFLDKITDDKNEIVTTDEDKMLVYINREINDFCDNNSQFKEIIDGLSLISVGLLNKERKFAVFYFKQDLKIVPNIDEKIDALLESKKKINTDKAWLAESHSFVSNYFTDDFKIEDGPIPNVQIFLNLKLKDSQNISQVELFLEELESILKEYIYECISPNKYSEKYSRDLFQFEIKEHDKDFFQPKFEDANLHYIKILNLFWIYEPNKLASLISEVLNKTDIIRRAWPAFSQIAASVDNFELYPFNNKYHPLNSATRYFVPNEFTIQLSSKHPDYMSQKDRILGFDVCFNQLTPGYFTLYLPENQNLFDVLSNLNDKPDVVFAEPSEFNGAPIESSVPLQHPLETVQENSKLDEQNHSLAKMAELDWQDEDFVWIHPRSTPRSQKLFFKLFRMRLDLEKYIQKACETFDPLTYWGHSMAKMRDAWNFTRGHNKVTLAVIDSPVDHKLQNSSFVIPHRAFARTDISFYDFSTNSDSSRDEKSGHGTSVASICSGVDPKLDEPNDDVFIGVAPKCKLMSVVVNSGTGLRANFIDSINFLTTEARKNPKQKYIINCSIAYISVNEALRHAIRRSWNTNNLIFVAPAGNHNNNLLQYPVYPACYKKVNGYERDMVMTIAGLNMTRNPDRKTSFGSKIIDLWAPSVNIAVANVEDTYSFESGTSYASPFVAGVLALIWSSFPEADKHKIMQLLIASRVSDHKWMGDNKWNDSDGIVNAAVALKSAIPARFAEKATHNLFWYLSFLAWKLFYVFLPSAGFERVKRSLLLISSTFLDSIFSQKIEKIEPKNNILKRNTTKA